MHIVGKIHLLGGKNNCTIGLAEFPLKSHVVKESKPLL